jgi:hypothetical protein
MYEYLKSLSKLLEIKALEPVEDSKYRYQYFTVPGTYVYATVRKRFLIRERIFRANRFVRVP